MSLDSASGCKMSNASRLVIRRQPNEGCMCREDARQIALLKTPYQKRLDRPSGKQYCHDCEIPLLSLESQPTHVPQSPCTDEHRNNRDTKDEPPSSSIPLQKYHGLGTPLVFMPHGNAVSDDSR